MLADSRPVSVRVGRLTGCLPQQQDLGAGGDEQAACAADVVLDFVLALDGHVVDGPVRTAYAPAGPSGAVWGSADASEQIFFAVKIRDLLPGCVLGVTAYVQGETKDAELLGSAVMSMFSKKGRLKTSLQRLCLCPGMQPDLRWPSRTPGKAPMAERGRMGELEQKLKQFERLDMPYMPRCSWLDGKTLSAIKDLQTSLAPDEPAKDVHVLFYLPSFTHAVLYSQPSMLAQRSADAAVGVGHSDPTTPFEGIFDPEVARMAAGQDTNPCEIKALKLSQASGRSGADRDVKPNKDERAALRAILSLPPTRPLTTHQKTQISKFRYSLASQRNTIIPFLKSVNWGSDQDVKLAVSAMNEWSYISIEEALLMLSGSLAHSAVRAKAMQVLHEHATDEDIYQYLIQLVQCVRHDGPDDTAQLSDFLVQRCWPNTKLSVALHWSLIVDCEEPALHRRIGHMQTQLYSALQEHNPAGHDAVNGQVRFKAFLDQFSKEMSTATSHRAREELLRAELTEQGRFSELLSMRIPFAVQPEVSLVSVLPERCKVFRSARSPVRFVFSAEATDPSVLVGLADDAEALPPVAAPRAPSPSKPLGGARLDAIELLFKTGDDLRQDQFVCQLIRVMDNLMRKEHLDLRLTPYWVLPMSPSTGVMEFVPSTTLQELTARSKAEGILRFLAQHNPGTPEPIGDVPASRLRANIANPAMENFIRSNAGYAIISYLLDMGDRHQENLLLTNDGKLFHIDFGYVLGMRDPKQWAKVPVPLKRDIIAAMGGQASEDYKHFRKLAVEAYIILRKHAALFLTLLGCMSGSAIDCFAGDSAAVSLDFALAQMEERFKVDVSDDAARTHIFTLIDQSIANMLASVGDTAHRIASNFRN